MSDLPAPSRRPLEVVIFHEGQQVARCLVRRGRYVIGHEEKNEITVDAPSLSARHARLTVVSETELYLEDLESANGTFVNGESATGMTPLPLDAEITLGATTLRLQRAGLPAVVFQQLSPDFLRTSRYQLGEILVQGHVSAIYSAYDTTLARTVAMKTLLPEVQADPDRVLRFIREAQVAAQLQHPGILPIYDLGINEQGRLYYTTQFIDGHTLAEILEKLTPDSPEAAARYPLHLLLRVWQSVCETIAFAHAQGVVHGALIPQNITVGHFGEVYVASWAGAKIMPAEGETLPAVTAPEAILQIDLSPFTSPEQASGTWEEIDPRTDVHALGGLLYKILTLRDPLPSETDDILLEAALNSRVIPPAQLPQDAPCPHWPGGRLPEFPAAVAMKALSLDRDDRPESVRALQQHLATWQDGTTASGEAGKLWKQFTGLLKKS